MKEVRIVGNEIILSELNNSIKVISRQLKVSNSIQITDRLFENGVISKETYIEELKDLLTR